MRMRFPICLVSVLMLALNMALAQSKAASVLIPLKVVAPPQLSVAPVFIAAEEGYFAQEGIIIEFVTLTRAVTSFPSLINGDLDVHVAGIGPAFFNAISRGGNLRIVAGVHTPNPKDCLSYALVARSELIESGKLRSAKDLVGKRVAGERSLWTPFFFEVFLAKDGLTLDDIEIIESPFPTRAEGMRKGLLDISFLSEPYLTQGLEGGGLTVWVPAYDIIPNNQITNIIFGPSLLEKSPDLGKKFLVAYLRGVAQHRQGKTLRNIEILSKTTGLSPEFLQRACWSPPEKNGTVMVNFIRDYQAWCARNKLIDKETPMEQLWDGQFLQYAQEMIAREKH